MNGLNVGDKVRIKIDGVGYRRGTIVAPGLNSFWVEYNGNKYLIATRFLVMWN